MPAKRPPPPDVSPDPQSLSELVELAIVRHGGASYRELERISKTRYEHGIGSPALSRMRRGHYGSTPDKLTVEILAWLAGVPFEVAHRAFGLGTPSEPFAQQLPRNVDLLTAEERRALIGLINVMIAGRRHGDVVDEPPAPADPTPNAVHFHEPADRVVRRRRN